MSLPVEAEVRSFLAPYQQPLVELARDAWKAWMDSPYVGRWRCGRSRANFVWEEIVDRALAFFESNSDVYAFKEQQTYQFLVREQVLFRFKKGDDHGLSANYPTQHALDFHDHDVNIFGLPEIQRVEVVYKLNKLETMIDDLLVVARDGDRVLWAYSLMEGDEGVMPLPIPLSPATPSVGGAGVVRAVVAPTEGAKKVE